MVCVCVFIYLYIYIYMYVYVYIICIYNIRWSAITLHAFMQPSVDFRARLRKIKNTMGWDGRVLGERARARARAHTHTHTFTHSHTRTLAHT